MTTQQLPMWLVYLQALGPVIVGACTVIIGSYVAFIARRQWATAQHKLRLDLFDRRLKIYREITLLHRAAIEGWVPVETFNRVFGATQDMEFLFDDQTFKAVSKVLDRLGALSAPATAEERKQVLDEWPQVHAAFARYLDLSKLG